MPEIRPRCFAAEPLDRGRRRGGIAIAHGDAEDQAEKDGQAGDRLEQAGKDESDPGQHGGRQQDPLGPEAVLGPPGGYHQDSETAQAIM
jgi:hypothetical protein